MNTSSLCGLPAFGGAEGDQGSLFDIRYSMKHPLCPAAQLWDKISLGRGGKLGLDEALSTGPPD
ncbi:MAG: hypothetical protein ABII06_17870, partial [Pseudomonadota bacterium]